MLVLVPTPNYRPEGINGLFGMGEDCPSYAPYRNEYGNCTNIAPASSSPAITPSSGSSNLFSNPTGYVAGQIYADSSLTQQQADAAEALARSQGLQLECTVNQNDGTPGYAGLYTTDCRFPGSVNSFDAGLLLQPGGMEIARNEDAYGKSTGLPIIEPAWLSNNPYSNQTFSFWQQATQQQTPQITQAQASTVTNQPNQSLPPRDTSVALPTTNQIPNTGKAFSAATVLESVQGFSESSGIGTTGLLIAAAAVLFFVMKGKG